MEHMLATMILCMIGNDLTKFTLGNAIGAKTGNEINNLCDLSHFLNQWCVSRLVENYEN